MANTIANVLTGVASLAVREPNNARAEWSTVEKYAGSYSIKLTKTGTGNAGSTHLELTGGWGTETFATWATGVAANQYTYWRFRQAIAGGFWEQVEFRFEDPDSDAWVEVTSAPDQGLLGSAIWEQQDMVDDDPVGFGGVTEIGTSFSDWTMAFVPSTVLAEVSTHAVGTADNWVLTRVRFELWEPAVARYEYIDSIVLNGIAITVEPGDASLMGFSLSSPYTDIGYTEDGVTMTYNADTADIEVEEETVAIDRVLTKESVEITCNMAEASLANMGFAMAGSVVSGSILTVGAGVLKTLNLRLEGTNPAGFKRQMFFPKATATGSVGMPYKKGEKTVVPVTFQALKPAGYPAFTVVDNAA